MPVNEYAHRNGRMAHTAGTIVRLASIAFAGRNGGKNQTGMWNSQSALSDEPG